jgi:hypothetical protein
MGTDSASHIQTASLCQYSDFSYFPPFLNLIPFFQPYDILTADEICREYRASRSRKAA